MGKLMKTLTISEVKKINGFWTAHKLHMVNHQKKHETILSMSNTKYNLSLTEQLFIVSNLEKGVF